MSKNTPYIDKNATVCGTVIIGLHSSIWPGAVLRADDHKIIVGTGSNIQDNATLHADAEHEVIIGNGVTIGHGAIIHGCQIGNNCLIGMGAIILSGARISDNTIIGAGALVPEGKPIERGTVAIGIPAKSIRQTSDEDLRLIKANAQEYIALANKYSRDK